MLLLLGRSSPQCVLLWLGSTLVRPHPDEDQANTHRVVQSPRTNDNFQTFDLDRTIDPLH